MTDSPDSSKPGAPAATSAQAAASAETPEPNRDPAFLALLHCPLGVSRPPLTLTPEGDALECVHCDCERGGHRFPFVEGFPDLRPETGGATPSPERSA